MLPYPKMKVIRPKSMVCSDRIIYATRFTWIPGINPVMIPKPQPMMVKRITARSIRVFTKNEIRTDSLKIAVKDHLKQK